MQAWFICVLISFLVAQVSHLFLFPAYHFYHKGLFQDIEYKFPLFLQWGLIIISHCMGTSIYFSNLWMSPGLSLQ